MIYLIFWLEFWAELLKPEPPRRTAEIIDLQQWKHDHGWWAA